MAVWIRPKANKNSQREMLQMVKLERKKGKKEKKVRQHVVGASKKKRLCMSIA